MRSLLLTAAFAHLARAQVAWEPGQSICPHLPGFRAADVYPTRGPLLMADFLIARVRGRDFVEIGSRNGDLSACLAQFARKTTIVESERHYCRALAARNLTVMCERVTARNAEALLPAADVYFWWMFPSMNLELVRLVHATLRARGKRALVVFPIDSEGMVPGQGRDIGQIGPQLMALRSAEYGYSGAVHRIFFDETVDDRQALDGEPVAAEGNTASYMRPFYGRYGRWGVLLVLSATVGAGVNQTARPRAEHHHARAEHHHGDARASSHAGTDRGPRQHQ